MKTNSEFPAQSDSKSKKKANKAKSFSVINPHAAWIDIGADSHWVSVSSERDSQPVRRFGCFTSDLYALANWLKECQVQTVRMESTGVYWIPQELQFYEVCQKAIAECDRKIEQRLAQFSDQVDLVASPIPLLSLSEN